MLEGLRDWIIDASNACGHVSCVSNQMKTYECHDTGFDEREKKNRRASKNHLMNMKTLHRR